ncbi:MAG: 50S ribosomal protein L18 [Candidatus Dormibacteraeota bacterium]|jgi:large subunit ribosomal protein L18|nr:50S ribosomal protein L18 [Candidatus Dormibacteraeota bacterium]
MTNQDRATARRHRHRRVRRRLQGTSERPRLCVYRSLRHLYAQVVDDTTGRTLVAASTVEDQLGAKGSNRASATAVGTAIAERAVAAGVNRVVFDRGGYLYHGRVQALADAARGAGLEF